MIVNTVLPKMQLGLFRQFDPYKKEEYFTLIRNNRRFTHTYVNGKTGVGKSTALINWALGDIVGGEGLAFFDVHGEPALRCRWWEPSTASLAIMGYATEHAL